MTPPGTTRRHLLLGSAALVGASASARALPLGLGAHARGQERLRVGVIGCGGRGTGAAFDSVAADEAVRIVALGDVFPDSLARCRETLAQLGPKVEVTDDTAFVGFDAVDRVLEAGVDLAILATPPHFRPEHLRKAVAAGVHVFVEKPVAVDAPGVRSVIESGEAAARQGLAIVAGTQRRHQARYLETLARVHDGAIGDLVGAQCWWNQGSLWMHPRQQGWSDMEWQLRNWLYFDWLSGDHICEQHIHNIDVVNWAFGGPPVRATAMGGRQVRTDPAYGNVFDHFAVELEYEGGVLAQSYCRQIDNCSNKVAERLIGTRGTADPTQGVIRGEALWRFDGEERNPYVQELVDLIASIRDGAPLNEARRVAESTLTAILGRTCAYTGRALTWDEMLASTLDLSPPAYELGPLAVRPVPTPGVTEFV